MARCKQSIDKTTRPEYVPLTIWKEYQECFDKPEIRAAFERVMFGDDEKNSQRAMARTWRAMDDARKAKLKYVVDECGGEFTDEFDSSGTYGALAMHIRNFANIRTEDFSNMQSPGERAERLRGAVSAGRRFLLMVKRLNSVSDYRDCVVDCLDYKQFEKEVLDECNRPGSKIDWAIREAAMDASIKAYERESEGKGRGYLYSDEAGMRAESRHASLGDYEAELRGKIVPMVVKHTFGRFEIPLQEYLESVLESMEDDAYWVMRERHILPRPGVDYPNKTYISN